MAKKKKTQNPKEGLKKHTAEMYDKTLSEMRERGASEEEIKLVEDAKKDALAAYDYVPETTKKQPYIKPEVKFFHTSKTPINIYSTLGRQVTELNKDFTPLFKNLFILRIGELPVYLVRFYYDRSSDKTICLSVMEQSDFSPEQYFSDNKKFKTLTVEYLSVVGETLRVDTYEGIKVKTVKNGERSYLSGDKPIETFIELKYKKKNVRTASKEKRTLSETEVKDS